MNGVNRGGIGNTVRMLDVSGALLLVLVARWDLSSCKMRKMSIRMRLTL